MVGILLVFLDEYRIAQQIEVRKSLGLAWKVHVHNTLDVRFADVSYRLKVLEKRGLAPAVGAVDALSRGRH